MTKKEQVRYEMLLRVRDFGTSHRGQFPEASPGGQLFAKVAEAVSAVEAHSTSKLLAAQGGLRTKAVNRAVVRNLMRAITRTARSIARKTPDLEHTFRMPERKSDVALLTAARGIITEAEAWGERFVHLGLAPSFIGELQKATDALESALSGRRSGRSGVAAGQAGIKAALAEGCDAVQTLDVIVANAVEQDPVVFAAWKRDRRVLDAPSKAKEKDEDELSKAS